MMIQDLGESMEAKIEKMQEKFNKDAEELKRNQAKMKNTTNEIKNTLDGVNSRITEAEEQVRDMEYKIVEITTAEQNKEKRMKRTEDSLTALWDNIKCTNIHIIGVPEGEEREKGPENMFEEIIAENFSNMGKETVTQVQEARRVTGRINRRRNTLRHI